MEMFLCYVFFLFLFDYLLYFVVGVGIVGEIIMNIY